MWILPLTLLIVFELVADILAKEWSLHGTVIRWIGAIMAYVVANIFWLFALRNGSGLARGAVIFSVSTAVVAVILGIFLYKENINKIQIIGIILGTISLILIFWNKN